MVNVRPTDQILGATVEGLDLATPLSADDFRTIVQALAAYGVLCFPQQQVDAADLKRFAARFGSLEINVANSFQEPGHPEVMILSNIVENGRAIGMADAGQDWHTDMSYSKTIAFANVLYALRVPRRDGRALGNTEFLNMRAAYDDLPDAIKRRLAGATATHDFNKFWEKMRRDKGSTRPPLTDEQRRRKPPVSQPVFLRHPMSGATVLYANPGYTIRIDDWPQQESDEMLAFLFAHQLQSKYKYAHRWSEHDVLMWDDLITLHNAVADYAPDEHRLVKRVQVMADRLFAPDYLDPSNRT